MESSPGVTVGRRLLVLVVTAAAFGSAQAQVPQPLLFEGVTLIDGTGRPAVQGAWVLVEGDRIAQVSREPISPPSGALRIDGAGKFLIPGLMDMHVHLRGSGSGDPHDRDPGAPRVPVQWLHDRLRRRQHPRVRVRATG